MLDLQCSGIRQSLNIVFYPFPIRLTIWCHREANPTFYHQFLIPFSTITKAIFLSSYYRAQKNRTIAIHVESGVKNINVIGCPERLFLVERLCDRAIVADSYRVRIVEMFIVGYVR